MRVFPLLAIAGLCATAAVASARSSMFVTSTGFQHAAQLPATYTCQGRGIAPPLNWGNPPPATKSIAILVQDPDAPKKTFTHWLVYDITPAIEALPEGGQLPPGAVAGYNSAGGLGYTAPCPPSGTHHYVFSVYALDTVLPHRAMTAEQFLAAIQGHVLGYGEDVGTAQRAASR